MKPKELAWMLLPVLFLAGLGLLLRNANFTSSSGGSPLSPNFPLDLGSAGFFWLLVSVLGLAVRFIHYPLLIAFGIWLYRRVHLPSLPWLGTNLLIMLPISVLWPFLWGRVVSKSYPSGWSVSNLVGWFNLMQQIVGGISSLLIALMILAEIAFLVEKAGVELDRPFVRSLLNLRNYSVPLGLLLLCSTLILPIMMLIYILAF